MKRNVGVWSTMVWHFANWGCGTSCTYLGGMLLRGVSSPHRYRQGMRGRTKAVILQLLKEYHRVELAFQVGYENGVQILRKQHSEDMTKVAADIFAHYYITGRNHLAIKLIVSALHVTCITCTCYMRMYSIYGTNQNKVPVPYS